MRANDSVTASLWWNRFEGGSCASPGETHHEELSPSERLDHCRPRFGIQQVDQKLFRSDRCSRLRARASQLLRTVWGNKEDITWRFPSPQLDRRHGTRRAAHRASQDTLRGPARPDFSGLFAPSESVGRPGTVRSPGVSRAAASRRRRRRGCACLDEELRRRNRSPIPRESPSRTPPWCC